MKKLKKFGNKIVKVIFAAEDSFQVRLRFADGFTGTLSLSHVFENPRGLAAEVTKGGMFARCFVESGALAWPNGLEFCPDAVRLWIDEQKQRAA